MSEQKKQYLDVSSKYWNPGKTQFWQDAGIDLLIDRREGYHLYDIDGRRLIDMHLNGGTYNLGHRNTELVETLKSALDHFDVGNHHFPAIGRAQLAEALYLCTPRPLQYSIFASGGSEAIDIALKCARHATKRKKFICLQKCYHGHTGLAVKVGDDRFSKLFLAEAGPDEVVQVPYNDLDAMERAIRPGDAAAVILETIPATYGFPIPVDGYHKIIRKLCSRHDVLYIADEVQTGLMRTGNMWGVDTYGVVPDILVTSKALGGGIYPIGAVVVNERSGAWLHEDGFGHISTYGGAELGCMVAKKVLEITQRPGVQANVQMVIARMAQGLEQIRTEQHGFLRQIRQCGLIIGLEFDRPKGAMQVMKACYDNGIWAIFSALDPQVLQFKPGLLLSASQCDEILERLNRAIGVAREQIPAGQYESASVRR